MPMKYWKEDYDQAEQKHFIREKMSTNVRKMDENENSSGCKSEIVNNGCALKSLSCESKEKVGSFWKVKLCTPCAPDFALGQGINKLGSCNPHTPTHTHTLNPHSLGGRKAKIIRRAKNLFMLFPAFYVAKSPRFSSSTSSSSLAP